VVGLPDGVWFRPFAPMNEIEAFTVRLVAPVGEREETFRQVTDDTINSPVARRALTRGSCELFDLTIYRGDRKRRSLECQAFDGRLEVG
jgi:hypothetical protein